MDRSLELPRRVPGPAGLRSKPREGAGHEYDDGELVVRPADFVALAQGRILYLPRRVLFLLFELVRCPGQVRTRADLAESAWGPGARRIKPQSVDQAISRLRHVLDDALPGVTYVHTQPGVGYRFLRRVSSAPTHRSRPGARR